MQGGIRPKFFMEAVQDEVATAQQGRPIFRMEERYELFIAGNPFTVPAGRITDEQRQRWPREYEAFKRGEEAPIEGTPLEEWPAVNKANVKELKYLEIHTIEDLATLSDLGTQRGTGLMGLRTMARAYLDDANKMALTQELTKENDTLKSQVAALENQVKELGDITTRLHAQMMGLQNAPNAVASAIPGLADPLQAAAQHSVREAPESSLARFAERRARRQQQREQGQENTEA
jgi:hypothetical protein